MPQVYEALNFLGRIKWRINQEVYDVVKEAWEKKAVIAELPDQEDMQIPPPDFQEVSRSPLSPPLRAALSLPCHSLGPMIPVALLVLLTTSNA